jgi:hypothetical protein
LIAFEADFAFADHVIDRVAHETIRELHRLLLSQIPIARAHTLLDCSKPLQQLLAARLLPLSAIGLVLVISHDDLSVEWNDLRLPAFAVGR